MKKQISKLIYIIAIVLVAGLAGCKFGCSSNSQLNDESRLIETQPQDVMVLNGTNAEFSIQSRAMDATFQWQFQGTNLAGQTSSSLVISNVDDSKLGLYSCLVTAGRLKVESYQVALFSFSINSAGILASVQGPLRPYPTSNCKCDNTNVVIKGYCSITNTNNTPYFPVPTGRTNCTADTFDVSDYNYDTILTVSPQYPTPYPIPSCNDDSPQAPQGYPHLSRLSFPAANGAYSFTIYTKTTPPTPAPILKLNLNWLPNP